MSLDHLEKRPWEFDFHAAMRRLECAHPNRPRWGKSAHPGDEPARLGQDPSLGFASAPLRRYRKRDGQRPDELRVAFFGMFGSQGALPLHVTEHARDRLRGVGDRTFSAFVDLLQHRMLVLLHRAWAMGQPTVAEDRPDDSAFARYVGSLCGRGSKTARGRDSLSDASRLQFAGRLAPRTRNAEGLEAMVSSYFAVEARVEPFVGQWVDVHEADRWRLGSAGSTLAMGTIAGARRFERGQKFRIHLGPFDRGQFETFLPKSRRLSALAQLVRSYVGDELAWDVGLHVRPGACAGLRLGGGSRMGYDTRLGGGASRATGQEALIVAAPNAERN